MSPAKTWSLQGLQRATQLLVDAEDCLGRLGCQFFACPGPNAAVFLDMRTCHRCWTLRQIRLFLKRTSRPQ